MLAYEELHDIGYLETIRQQVKIKAGSGSDRNGHVMGDNVMGDSSISDARMSETYTGRASYSINSFLQS